MKPEDLMDWGDIARIYRTTRRKVRDVIAKDTDFPRPVKGSSVRDPLYLSDHIRSYMLQEAVAQ